MISATAAAFLGARGHARAVAGGDVVGDAADLEAGGLAGLQRRQHPRPQVAIEQGQDVGPAHGVTQARGLLQEQRVETGGVDLGALEAGPGVGVGIGRIDRADEVVGQATLDLITPEGLERRGGEHAAEIPDHRLDRHSALKQLFDRR
jgi:hypothetical protein